MIVFRLAQLEQSAKFSAKHLFEFVFRIFESSAMALFIQSVS